MAPEKIPLIINMTSFRYCYKSKLEELNTAWFVDTLKIVGEGEVIKVVLFPKALFEQFFIGVKTTAYIMHFIKYKEGRERMEY